MKVCLSKPRTTSARGIRIMGRVFTRLKRVYLVTKYSFIYYKNLVAKTVRLQWRCLKLLGATVHVLFVAIGFVLLYGLVFGLVTLIFIITYPYRAIIKLIRKHKKNENK